MIEALAGKVLATILERSGTVAAWVQAELERATETLAASFMDNCNQAVRELGSSLEEILTERFLPELKEKESALEDLRDQRRRQVLDAAERRRTLAADVEVLEKIAGAR